jgi:hypothetical protein
MHLLRKICSMSKALLPALSAVLAGILLSAAGCGSEIGDSCTTNLDCSPMGDRICDVTQADGYCTVVGCSGTSCPDDAVCVRFFSASFLFIPCDPETEDSLDPLVTPTNECTVTEICLSSGYCAQRSSEQRYCMKACEKNSDCRDGYECRLTGTLGSEPVLEPGRTRRDKRFCAMKANP